MTSAWQNDDKTERCQTFVKTLDNGSTLTDERTNGLTNDYQDQGSNRLVPNAPNPVDNRRIITVEGDRVEWVACKKHLGYLDSGYLVLSCKKCIVRLAVA